MLCHVVLQSRAKLKDAHTHVVLSTARYIHSMYASTRAGCAVPVHSHFAALHVRVFGCLPNSGKERSCFGKECEFSESEKQNFCRLRTRDE